MRTLNFNDNSDIDFRITDGEESLKQRITQKLKFLRGEWFINQRQGMPYYQELLGQNASNLQLMRRIIIQQILDIEDVQGVSNVAVSFDRVNRVYQFSANVQSVTANITINRNL